MAGYEKRNKSRGIDMFEDIAKPKKYTREVLYHKQISMLKIMLQSGAITQGQYDKSAGDLTKLMGYSEKQ